MIYAPKHPLLDNKDFIDMLLRQLPNLADPRELLGVLLTLNKIKATDFCEYHLPTEKLPKVDADWLKVCPFTGRANFSGSQLPKDRSIALTILKSFASVCLWGYVDKEQASAFSLLFSGKHVRFWYFSKDWTIESDYFERTYP